MIRETRKVDVTIYQNSLKNEKNMKKDNKESMKNSSWLEPAGFFFGGFFFAPPPDHSFPVMVPGFVTVTFSSSHQMEQN